MFTSLILASSILAQAGSLHLLGETADGTKYQVVTSMTEVVASTDSVTFVMRTDRAKPIKIGNDIIVSIVEETVVICKAEKVITTSQAGMNSLGETVIISTSPVIYNVPLKNTMLIAQMHKYGCDLLKKKGLKSTI